MSSNTKSRSLAPPPVAWRNWPLRDEPAAARLAALVVLLLAVGVIAATGSGWLALGAVAAVVLAMWRMFIPIEYHLGSRGLRQSYLRRNHLVRWSQIKVIEVRRHGILLYPDSYFGPLRAMRGVYVPWGSYHDEVIALVAFYAPSLLVDYENDPQETDQSSDAGTSTLDDTADYEPTSATDDSTETNVRVEL